MSSAVTLATKKGTQKATAAAFRLVLATVTAWVRTASDPNARIFCQNDVIRAHAQTLISGSRKAVGGTGTGTAFQSLPMLLQSARCYHRWRPCKTHLRHRLGSDQDTVPERVQ